jgi:DNA-binding beta-propeller fold protein YncE
MTDTLPVPPMHPTSRRELLLALAAGAGWLAGCAEVAPAGKPIEIPVYPPAPERPRFIWERTLRSSADVLPDEEDGSLRRLVTGEVRAGEGLGKPYGVAARNGKVYVGDTVSRMVFLYDLARRQYKRIGADDPGALRMPFGLDLDEQGHLYVMDGTAKRVQVYDAEGKHLRTLGADLKWSRPAGLALDSARRRVYAVDAGGVNSPDHRVLALDMDSGKLLFEFGKRGSEPGELNLPRDAAVNAAGEVFVVDGGNFRVQVYNAEGQFLRGFGTVGRQSGQFSRPKEIALDRQGNAYIVDTAFGNFQIFNPAGQLLLDVGTRANADGPARFMLPSGIAVDQDGRVYMVDQYFRKVEVFRPADLAATAPYGALAAQ